MSPEEIASEIKRLLGKQHITPRVLTDRLRLIDDDSRRSGQYLDPNYLPFYYHLSKFVQAKSVLNLGLDLGLPLCCFLQGSSSVSRALCFQRSDKGFYSPRLALGNIRDVSGRRFSLDFYLGSLLDREMQDKMTGGFDLVMITEKCSPDIFNEMLEVCWNRLELDGYLVVERVDSDKLVGEVFASFCKSKNRSFIAIPTRYGNGFSQK